MTHRPALHHTAVDDICPRASSAGRYHCTRPGLRGEPRPLPAALPSFDADMAIRWKSERPGEQRATPNRVSICCVFWVRPWGEQV